MLGSINTIHLRETVLAVGYLLAGVRGDGQTVGNQTSCPVLLHQSHRDHRDGYLEGNREKQRESVCIPENCCCVTGNTGIFFKPLQSLPFLLFLFYVMLFKFWALPWHWSHNHKDYRQERYIKHAHELLLKCCTGKIKCACSPNIIFLNDTQTIIIHGIIKT